MTTSSALRILYVPNEHGDTRQIGFRRPFANLIRAGLIGEVRVYSLLLRIRSGQDPKVAREGLANLVSSFQPHIILMQHLAFTGLSRSFFTRLRATADFQLIYHEGDPYRGPLHPLPREAAAAGRAADVVFTVGSGTFRKNFERVGARNVQWAPSCFDPDRFSNYPIVAADRKYDVVVVGNRNRPRLRGHPNWKDRIRFVEHLQKAFGDRLAIYGANWSGVGAKGPVAFDQQDTAVRTGWVSANWDHYATEPNYFSNRLPISLQSGTIHASTRHDGYQELFNDGLKEGFLVLGDSPESLVDAIAAFLESTSTEERLAAALKGREFAQRRFRQDDQLVSFLNFDRQLIDPRTASDCWDLNQDPLREY